MYRSHNNLFHKTHKTYCSSKLKRAFSKKCYAIFFIKIYLFSLSPSPLALYFYRLYILHCTYSTPFNLLILSTKKVYFLREKKSGLEYLFYFLIIIICQRFWYVFEVKRENITYVRQCLCSFPPSVINL